MLCPCSANECELIMEQCDKCEVFRYQQPHLGRKLAAHSRQKLSVLSS